MSNDEPSLTFTDHEPAIEEFRRDVLRGLAADEKYLACKYFYDERGSLLFEQICELEEYYPTRTEVEIMRASAAEMADAAGPRCRIVEFGSGSSLKTRLLLDHLHEPAAYVPVEISREALTAAASDLAAEYPNLEILPVCADFTGDYTLPEPAIEPARTLIYFPGSTIGNFPPAAAVRFLARAAKLAEAGGAMLIGVDLKKDEQVLRAAYNDSEGVTAAFNLNLLARINRDLHADFDVEAFEHEAIYNEVAGRMEMYLVSLKSQKVRIGDADLRLAQGERISTEWSHKYHPAEFARIAEAAGWRVEKVWTDPQHWFSVQYLCGAV